jgi:hypothetical protein
MKKPSLKILAALRAGRGMGLLALLLAATLSSCEKGCGDDPRPEPNVCNTEVTVATATCGGGAFQSNWFKLPNGEWLQPFENQTGITQIKPGQRYRIGYEAMPRDKRYDGQAVCLALPPTGQAIRVLCMTPLGEPAGNCDTYVTARAVNCSVGAWGETWFQLDDGQYLQPWLNNTGTQTLTEGNRYKISFTLTMRDNRYQNIFLCAAMPQDSLAWNPQVVSVNCLEPVN